MFWVKTFLFCWMLVCLLMMGKGFRFSFIFKKITGCWTKPYLRQ
jgi:hypothetical protein